MCSRLKLIALGIALYSCSPKHTIEEIVESSPLFKAVPAETSGLKFSNNLKENDSINILSFEYCYNGGGVGIGDINNDGLPDVFFTGNQVKSRLFLNLGGLKFKDITDEADLNTEGWATGVCMVDLNADGFMDIYVSYSGSGNAQERANKYFENQGDTTFVERASELGIADTGWTTQSTFQDFDKDGDLDLYVLNHANSFSKKTIMDKNSKNGKGEASDRFYTNDNGIFKNVTEFAGLGHEGYGLGLAVTDINGDGWSDIYVSNDYYYDDFIYINNHNGTFSEQGHSFLKHSSNFSMGIDVADVNNDALEDIIVLDMLPHDNYRRKKLLGPLGLDLFNSTLRLGYMPQYMKNTLQLNNGGGYYSEVGHYSGTHSTDWSWAPLIADFNNDGNNDVYITNGFRRNMTDRDFMNYRVNQESMLGATSKEKVLEILHKMEGGKMSNYLLVGDGQSHFDDISAIEEINLPSFSNGAAYADLDNDGDLEIIVNNINDDAFLFQNLSIENKLGKFVEINLHASPSLSNGSGVTLYMGDSIRYRTFYTERGFQSSMNGSIHFGVGKLESIDSIVVIWADGRESIKRNIGTNKVLIFDHGNSTESLSQPVEPPLLFKKVNHELKVHFYADEFDLQDFKREPLMTHQYSKNGPGLAVGDVNGDGLEDFYVAGSSGSSGELFIQGIDGRFSKSKLDTIDYFYEELGALFFDADNDNDLDLYLVSGGNDVPKLGSYYNDRIYINDGKGDFTKDNDRIPFLRTSGGCVKAADVDNDGDLDLFVGGRVVPARFPAPADSHLLINNNGQFEIAPPAVIKLDNFGLVSDAMFTDFNNDGWPDLIVVGEWMEISMLENRKGTFVNITESTSLNNVKGWWNSIASGDFDNDGDMDYIIGNLGLNNGYNIGMDTPLRVYTQDYDNNGSLDPILSYYNDGKEYTVASRDMLQAQLSMMGRRFPDYESYATAELNDVLTEEEVSNSYVLEMNVCESIYIENVGGLKFVIKYLPKAAQLFPIYGMNVLDVNDDEFLDVVVAGNMFSSEVLNGSYNAGNGLILFGNGDGTFNAVNGNESGFYVPGDSKGMARLVSRSKVVILATQNLDSLLAYELQRGIGLKIVSTENRDVRAEIGFKDGTKRRVELYHGDSYLSGGSRALVLPKELKYVTIYNNDGKERKVAID